MGAQTEIVMGVFYRSLPMIAATELGFYADEGLHVDHQRVSSSIQQFRDLRDGAYDLVQTSPDNVANYRFNDGNPLDGRVDVQAFLGLDYGMYLVLVARPGIEHVTDLRGCTLSVDAPTSGFAYVLYRILERHGLHRDRDYDLALTGGVFARYQALLEDEFDGTLLSGGFETRAARQGYVLLDSVTDIADPYLGVVAAARTDWLQANRQTAVSLVRGYQRGLAWSLDPANRQAAVELIRAEYPNTDDELAAALYELQLRPGVGVVPDADVEPAALRNVLQLREEFGGFEQAIDLDAVVEPGGLFDPGYRDEALTSAQHP